MALLVKKHNIPPELVVSYSQVDLDFNPNLGGPSGGKPVYIEGHGRKVEKGCMKLTCKLKTAHA